MMDNRSAYVEVFKALSDETRLDILEKLTTQELCACELQAAIRSNIAQSSLSYHMKILTDAGLILSVREGKWIRYSIDIEKFKQLQIFLYALTSQNT